MRSRNNIFNRLTAALYLIILATPAAYPATAGAAGDVDGRYLDVAGRHVSLEFTIRDRAITSVIVIQHLPRGTTIVSATPSPRKVNAGRGIAKWFIVPGKSGKTTVTFELSAPVSRNDLGAELVYRNPVTGKMERIHISP